MEPGEETDNAGEQNVNITNHGNVNLNLSVDGFGSVDSDGLAMNCTQGNITVGFLRYNTTKAQNYNLSTYALTDDKLSSGIPEYTVPRRTDDGDASNLKSTNTTYWKLGIPIGNARGFCNGTVTFSAVV